MVASYDVIFTPKNKILKMTSNYDVMTSMTCFCQNGRCLSILLVCVSSFMMIPF